MTSKAEIKKLIRHSTQIKRDEYLQNLQKSHKKSSHLTITEKPQEYLMSTKLSIPMKNFHFSLRNRMSPNKVNFKKKFSDLVCRLCEIEESEESLLHFIYCDLLLQNVPEVSSIKPEDIFGSIDEQVKATQVWMKVFQHLEQSETNQAHS